MVEESLPLYPATERRLNGYLSDQNALFHPTPYDPASNATKVDSWAENPSLSHRATPLKWTLKGASDFQHSVQIDV